MHIALNLQQSCHLNWTLGMTLSFFVGEVVEMDPNIGVVAIGGTDLQLQGIGDAQISWKDDDGVSHTYRLKKALYFPESP
eukprot:6669079-Ditylum_brightwellii.AAC.1